MTSPNSKQHLGKVRSHPEHVPTAADERHAKMKAERAKRVSVAGERSASPPGKALRLLRRPKPDAPTG
jgi:hypothetical protein